jgi:acetate kinase
MMILTINGGSSSLRFGVFESNPKLPRLFSGKIDRIGLKDPHFILTDHRTGKSTTDIRHACDHAQAVSFLIKIIDEKFQFHQVDSIGHRVIHGGPRYHRPERITPVLLAELKTLEPLNPEHMPSMLQIMNIFHSRFPSIPQIACFDTAFHFDMPKLARLLAIPRSYYDRGVRRYGFHGISYSYLIEELARLNETASRGRVIFAHLGNGVSLAAVHEGRCVDTTMGFTPTAGLPMSTRSGDLDPGVLPYLSTISGQTLEELYDMLNTRSGLAGLSESGSDMRDLLALEKTDTRAAEAVAYFCYHVRRWIGGYAAVLGGINTLVFSGGMGEKSAAIRARICAGLDFLGVYLDETKNESHDPIISREGAPVTVRVIPTDEEKQIAKIVFEDLSKR